MRKIGVFGIVSAVMVMFASAGVGSPVAAEIDGVRLYGCLGERLEAMIGRHVVGTDVDYITACFRDKSERRRCWRAEFWGKYMHSAIPYLKYTGSEALRSAVERSVDAVLETQEENGYIGDYPAELRCADGWDVWGMKYTMMGLLHYEEFARGSERADQCLEACERLGDFLIGEIGPGGKCEPWQTGNWSGMASSSVLEPVVWLYNRTGERRFLDFAAFIVKGMSEAEVGPRLIDLALKGVSVADRNDYGKQNETGNAYVLKHSRRKAYEMMSCYQGLIEYAQAAKRSGTIGAEEAERLIKAAMMTAEDIAKEEVNLAGGCASSEAWFHGASKQHLAFERLQETCVTTTWMRLCEKLLEVTGEPKWADRLEQTFYNAYLAAMKRDGSEFAGYTPLNGDRWHGQNHCYMHTDCCTANGPRGFLCVLKKMFCVHDNAAEVNFYASARMEGALSNGERVVFDMYSLYPRTNEARIESRTEGVGEFALRLRIPGWSVETQVKLNGKALSGAKAGEYLELLREWKRGDVVELAFDMPVVAHTLENGHFAAFTRGPVLLARDSRFGDGDLSEPLRRGSVSEGRQMDEFKAVRGPSDEMWMVFSAVLPIGVHHANPEGGLGSAVSFCDYASAGNRWERGNFYRSWFAVERGPNEP